MTTSTEGAEANDFAAVLSSIRPRSARELGEALQLLVGRVKDTGKAGSITYTVKVSPVDGGTDVLAVNDEIKTRLPEHERKGSLAWPDEHNNLTRSDPNTMPLFRDEDLRTPQFDPRTGEIKEPPAR